MEDAIVTAGTERSTAKPSFAVVTRIADREGTNPEALTPPLYAVIDPEALDSLFDSASADAAGRITFTYCGYEVRVESGGEVSISES